MNKIKLFLKVLLFSLLFSGFFIAFETLDEGCDGCKRTAVLMRVTGGIDLNSFTSRLVERVTNPCFHLLYSGEITELGTNFNWKSPEGSPEYYFTASYEANQPGQIKSRLNISLYFENGELIHQWVTESDNPNFTYHGHLQKMFINNSALLRKWVPLHITLLNDFEKQPSKCDIKPDKEELFPGQKIKVKLSNIVDFEGRKSREFNRIVIQAVDGEIIGGTPLAADPGLKAFQVGDGTITFTYRAPDGEKSRITEDKIIVYNSCDILRKDEYPMPKTGLKDKIAEKKIKIIQADAEATVTTIYRAHLESHLRGERSTDDEESSEEIRVTIKSAFEHDHTSSYEEEDEYEEHYNLISSQIISFNGKSKEHLRNFNWQDDGHTYERIYDFKISAVNFRQEEEGNGMVILFNARTQKAIEVQIYDAPVNFKWAGKGKETKKYTDASGGTRTYNEETDINEETFFIFNGVSGFPEIEKAKSGDGVHEISGGGTHTTPGYDQLTIKWEIKRYRKK